MGDLFSKSQCLPTEQQMPKIDLGLQIHTVSGQNYFSTFEVQLLVLGVYKIYTVFIKNIYTFYYNILLFTLSNCQSRGWRSVAYMDTIFCSLGHYATSVKWYN